MYLFADVVAVFGRMTLMIEVVAGFVCVWCCVIWSDGFAVTTHLQEQRW